MALKLDEDYNGSTLLSTWWQKVKSNFAAVKAAVDAVETELSIEVSARESFEEALAQERIERTEADGAIYERIYSGEAIRDTQLEEETRAREALQENVSSIEADLAQTKTDNDAAHEMMVTEYMALAETLEGKKQNCAAINKNYTATEITLTPADNNEYLYGELDSLVLTVEAPVEGYASWIAFTSGDTATEMEYEAYIHWSGDDVADGVFTPASGVRYNIGLWYDGVNLNAVVRGVSV